MILVCAYFVARSQISGKRLLSSSCLSVCPHGTTRLPLQGFSCNFKYLKIFRNSVQKIQVPLKSDKYRIFSNLIRTSFYPFLKRKKSSFAVLIHTFPSTAHCTQLLQKSQGGCQLRGKPSRRALSSDLSRSVV